MWTSPHGSPQSRIQPADLMAQRNRRFRNLFLLLTAGGAVFMVGWIVLLGFTLPARSTTDQWPLVWIGFDIAELLALAVTGYAAWRSRWLVIPASVVTGTLLLCDAWFDVILSWGTSGWLFSIGLAAFLEIPLAVLLWFTATRLGRLNLRVERQVLGLQGMAPGIRQLVLFTPLGAHEVTLPDPLVRQFVRSADLVSRGQFDALPSPVDVAS
jgi:hypothetical protein